MTTYFIIDDQTTSMARLDFDQIGSSANMTRGDAIRRAWKTWRALSAHDQRTRDAYLLCLGELNEDGAPGGDDYEVVADIAALGDRIKSEAEAFLRAYMFQNDVCAELILDRETGELETREYVDRIGGYWFDTDKDRDLVTIATQEKDYTWDDCLNYVDTKEGDDGETLYQLEDGSWGDAETAAAEYRDYLIRNDENGIVSDIVFAYFNPPVSMLDLIKA